ncbi:MAG: cold shock domain-containing protein [Stappiaceae bacterium]
MQSGNVRWFDAESGVGAIDSENGNSVLVYRYTLERAGLTRLDEGQLVAYELNARDGKNVAEDLKVL